MCRRSRAAVGCTNVIFIHLLCTTVIVVIFIFVTLLGLERWIVVALIAFFLIAFRQVEYCYANTVAFCIIIVIIFIIIIALRLKAVRRLTAGWRLVVELACIIIILSTFGVVWQVVEVIVLIVVVVVVLVT